MPRTRRSGRPARRRQLSADDQARLIYREADFLRQFLTERGKIKSRATTGLSRRDQVRMARAVKVARELALLPYSAAVPERERRR